MYASPALVCSQLYSVKTKHVSLKNGTADWSQTKNVLFFPLPQDKDPKEDEREGKEKAMTKEHAITLQLFDYDSVGMKPMDFALT